VNWENVIYMEKLPARDDTRIYFNNNKTLDVVETLDQINAILKGNQ